MSDRVCDLLWSQAQTRVRDEHTIIVSEAQTEQGFRVDTHGTSRRAVVDFDGLRAIRLLC